MRKYIAFILMALALSFAQCWKNSKPPQTVVYRGGGDEDPGDPPIVSPVQQGNCPDLFTTNDKLSFSVTTSPETSDKYNYEVYLVCGDTVLYFSAKNATQGLYNVIPVPPSITPGGWEVKVRITPTDAVGDLPNDLYVDFCSSATNRGSTRILTPSALTSIPFGKPKSFPSDCVPTPTNYHTPPICGYYFPGAQIVQTGPATGNLYSYCRVYATYTCGSVVKENLVTAFSGSRNGATNWGAGFIGFNYIGSGYYSGVDKIGYRVEHYFKATGGASATCNLVWNGLYSFPDTIPVNGSKLINKLVGQNPTCALHL